MRLPGVVPLLGVKLSQAGCAPTAATVYASAGPVLSAMVSVVDAGTVVLVTVKAGLPVITMVPAPAAATVSVTFTVVEVNPVAEMVTEPAYVPAARPVGTTEIIRLLGVAPVAGETASHLPPLVVAAIAEKEAAALLDVLMATLCAAGVLAPV